MTNKIDQALDALPKTLAFYDKETTGLSRRSIRSSSLPQSGRRPTSSPSLATTS